MQIREDAKIAKALVQGVGDGGQGSGMSLTHVGALTLFADLKYQSNLC